MERGVGVAVDCETERGINLPLSGHYIGRYDKGD